MPDTERGVISVSVHMFESLLLINHSLCWKLYLWCFSFSFWKANPFHHTCFSNKNKRKIDSFDARVIFDHYGSEEWGEYPIREAHLSQRFAFDESGYYHCCASIPFPDNMQVE